MAAKNSKTTAKVEDSPETPHHLFPEHPKGLVSRIKFSDYQMTHVSEVSPSMERAELNALLAPYGAGVYTGFPFSTLNGKQLTGVLTIRISESEAANAAKKNETATETAAPLQFAAGEAQAARDVFAHSEQLRREEADALRAEYRERIVALDRHTEALASKEEGILERAFSMMRELSHEQKESVSSNTRDSMDQLGDALASYRESEARLREDYREKLREDQRVTDRRLEDMRTNYERQTGEIRESCDRRLQDFDSDCRRQISREKDANEQRLMTLRDAMDQQKAHALQMLELKHKQEIIELEGANRLGGDGVSQDIRDEIHMRELDYRYPKKTAVERVIEEYGPVISEVVQTVRGGGFGQRPQQPGVQQQQQQQAPQIGPTAFVNGANYPSGAPPAPAPVARPASNTPPSPFGDPNPAGGGGGASSSSPSPFGPPQMGPVIDLDDEDDENDFSSDSFSS